MNVTIMNNNSNDNVVCVCVCLMFDILYIKYKKHTYAILLYFLNKDIQGGNVRIQVSKSNYFTNSILNVLVRHMNIKTLFRSHVACVRSSEAAQSDFTLRYAERSGTKSERQTVDYER